MTDPEIRALSDLASTACVHFRPIEPEFSKETSDRLFQEYGVRIAPERILELALHYREIYQFTSGVLPEYYRPNHRKVSAPNDYDLAGLQARMAEQFPEDPPEVLFSVMHRVILYEYLL